MQSRQYLSLLLNLLQEEFQFKIFVDLGAFLVLFLFSLLLVSLLVCVADFADCTARVVQESYLSVVSAAMNDPVHHVIARISDYKDEVDGPEAYESVQQRSRTLLLLVTTLTRVIHFEDAFGFVSGI